MQVISFEFDSERDLQDATKKLWEDLKVTGEMQIKPIGNGRWRIDLNSEKDLRESTLEKFPGKRVNLGKAQASAEGSPPEGGPVADDEVVATS